MMKEKLTIVKVGGAVVEDEGQLAQLLKDFSAIEGRKVLVHGGGRRATQVAASLGIESKMVNGRRITDADMLSVVTMVYGGYAQRRDDGLWWSGQQESCRPSAGQRCKCLRTHRS